MFKNITLAFLTILLFSTNIIRAQDSIKSSDLIFTDIDSTAVEPVQVTEAKNSTVNVKSSMKQNKSAVKPPVQSLWSIFLAGLAGGLAAVLMPCIFPMLPLTVSYFTKTGGDRVSALRRASLYGASIIVIYVTLGLAVTIIFGADALNSLSTNGVFNFAFFLLIVIFAASFLGAFEINLATGTDVSKRLKTNQQFLR